MARVWIPALLRDLTSGQEMVAVSGKNIGEVIGALDKLFPGVKNRLCHADELRPGIAVAVDTQISRRGLTEPVAAASEVHFLPAISGGCLTASPASCHWVALSAFHASHSRLASR